MPQTLHSDAAKDFVDEITAKHAIDVLDTCGGKLRFSHSDAAAALHYLVYYSKVGGRVTIRFGAAGELIFPLGPMTAPKFRNVNPDLRIGLCSGRHAAMDPKIDFYLVEGNELNQHCHNRGEQADFARHAAVDLMGDRLDDDKVVELVHTGAHSLVIGAYCGIVDVALNGQRRYILSRTLRRRWVSIAPGVASRLAAPPFVDYFEIGNGLFVRWKVERPMNEAERDDLKRFMSSQTASALYNASQYGPIDYREESIWG
jgi:hypothetical protein